MVSRGPLFFAFVSSEGIWRVPAALGWDGCVMIEHFYCGVPTWSVEAFA